MITINILWLPLIIIAILIILDIITNDFKWSNQPNNELNFGIKLMVGIVMFMSIIIYILAGIYWLYNHINIVI